MIMVVQARSTESTEFAPAMAEDTGILPGLSAIAGKPVHVSFDGGRLTSDGLLELPGHSEQNGFRQTDDAASGSQPWSGTSASRSRSGSTARSVPPQSALNP